MLFICTSSVRLSLILCKACVWVCICVFHCCLLIFACNECRCWFFFVNIFPPSALGIVILGWCCSCCCFCDFFLRMFTLPFFRICMYIHCKSIHIPVLILFLVFYLSFDSLFTLFWCLQLNVQTIYFIWVYKMMVIGHIVENIFFFKSEQSSPATLLFLELQKSQAVSNAYLSDFFRHFLCNWILRNSCFEAKHPKKKPMDFIFWFFFSCSIDSNGFRIKCTQI